MQHIHLPHNHGQAIEKLADSLPSVSEFSEVSNLFRLLGDCSRIKIFWLLCHCEECVINISAMMEMSSPAVSHHLKLLKTAGLVLSRREGKEVYYKAASTERADALHKMLEMLIDLSCPSGKETNSL